MKHRVLTSAANGQNCLISLDLITHIVQGTELGTTMVYYGEGKVLVNIEFETMLKFISEIYINENK